MRRIASLVLLLTAVAVGCGGGSSRTATETKADYIDLADAICRNHQSRREDLESQAADLGPLDSPRKARRVAGLLGRESRNLHAEAKELSSREAPPDGRAPVAAIVSLMRERAAVIDRWAAAYDGLDETAIRTLQIRLGVLTARAETRARAYGVQACGG